ncbi:bifunctional folylpolyglutamate synthase/dihydrofolate synthase [Tellurirhabdus rosea]|uniref:bifunctional folylpolyglutamate synthase/dihydrofolate synthase n=1 Tax=Tellurirhabdus rosea TaxID=2674997 RepID=UPI002258EC43|nr:folylpolyglutamate synthase/dihydrofolate synthase family protein [Tellurirhabdus rosea]
MTYSESIEYLYSRLPVFHRVGAKAIKPGLGNIIRLCQALGNPQEKLKYIHVGGTNGKGSSSHLLASVLQCAGYRTGLYTSPHLKSFTERIRINGVSIAEERVAEFVKRHQNLIEEIEPSFFEITLALAFDEFARQQVDIAVMEVGLGGRLDSTNIITPVVSLITNIGWDHADVLGDTLEAIAFEKAGIIKPNVAAVISQRSSDTDFVFQQSANEKGARLLFAEDVYRVVPATGAPVLDTRRFEVWKQGEPWGEIESGLLGEYQQRNLGGVLATLDEIQMVYPVPREAILKGVREVVSLTGLKGRWQILQKEPMVICDTAHNEPGLSSVFSALSRLSFSGLHIVVGFVKDKDLERVIALFPEEATYYFTQPRIPRALPVQELAQVMAARGLAGSLYADVNEALEAAVSRAGNNDCILVTGSTYLVAELNKL